jgi:putative endonuclease
MDRNPERTYFCLSSANVPQSTQTMSKHLETGRQGEQLAASFLESKGFRVAATNYRFLKAEIDLIVATEKLLVFVEVKTRSGTAYGMPEAAVSARKAKLIVSAAEQYIQEIDWTYEIRFDIVSVLLIGNHTEIEHLEDAFY